MAASLAVFAISKNGVPKSSKLDANLVRAPGDEPNLDKAFARACAKRCNHAKGFARVRAFGARAYALCARAASLGKIIADQAWLCPGPGSCNPGNIFLDQKPLAKSLLKHTQGRMRGAHKQDAGCVPVKPVGRGGHKGRAPGMGRKTRTQAVLMAAPGLHRKASRLVKGPDVAMCASQRRQGRKI